MKKLHGFGVKINMFCINHFSISFKPFFFANKTPFFEKMFLLILCQPNKFDVR